MTGIDPVRHIIYLTALIFLFCAGLSPIAMAASSGSGSGGSSSGGSSLPRNFGLGTPRATCDENFLNSMESRAWMEAQREIEQNQNLIVKADSVMEYTCFDQFLGHWAQHYASFFMGGAAGGNVKGDISKALTSLVQEGLEKYIKSNFDHDYLGGRDGTARSTPAKVSSVSYSCSEMNKVWEEAKCYNFQPASESQDGFKMFEELVSANSDPRKYPKGCKKDTRWSDAHKVALLEPPWSTQDWIKNNLPSYKTIRDFLDVNNCANIPPIPTGVIADAGPPPPPGQQLGPGPPVTSNLTWPDAVCAAPGCYYQLPYKITDPNTGVTTNHPAQCR